MNQKPRENSMDSERPAAKITREFDFPRARVFNMLTDPRKGAVSWSPDGAVNLVFELDLRPGGAIRIHDRGIDGKVAKTTGTVVDIQVPELLVVQTTTTPPAGGAPWEALQTLAFQELGPQRTRVTVLVKVLGIGSFPGGGESLAEGFEGGWGQVLMRLEGALP